MEYTTISEACTLHARIGWQGLTKSEYLDEGDYYLVTGVDFNNGHIAFDTCHFVTKERYDQDQHIQLQLNDVLVTKDGTIGKVAFIDSPIDKPATLNSGVFVVRPKNPDLLLPEYLMIMLMSNHFSRFIEQIKVGCTIAHLNQEKFLRYEFPLPPVAEQKHIIEVYYSVSKIINHRQRQLLALDTLIKARFVEMFGDPELNPMDWPTDNLGKLLSVEPQNGLYKPQSDYVQDGTGTGTPILRIDAFYDGKVTSFCELKRLNCTDSEKHRYLLHENDIVINRVNSIEYLGKCAWISGMREPTVFESNMMRFHTDESLIDPCYLTRLLCSTYIYNQILNRAKKAVNQASINQGDVQSFKILIPPINLQRQFAAFVSQVDKSKVAVQAALEKAQLLFDSLMQQYFG